MKTMLNDVRIFFSPFFLVVHTCNIFKSPTHQVNFLSLPDFKRTFFVYINKILRTKFFFLGRFRTSVNHINKQEGEN